MPLDPIMDTVSEDRHSASSMVHIEGDGGTPVRLLESDEEFSDAVGSTAEGAKHSALYRRVWSQMHRSIRRLFDFFLENIVLNTIKLVETCWLIFLQLWALMIRCWLGFFKRVNRCVEGCVCCCKKPKVDKHHMAPSDTSEDETTDHEEAAKEPVLVVINLDRVLVHASSKQPKFVSPFDKPQ